MTALQEDLAKAAQSGWGRGRVLVTALWPEIEQALADGHTRSRIWRTLTERGELTLSYPQFVVLVRQRLTAASPAPIPQVPMPAPSETVPRTVGEDIASVLREAAPVKPPTPPTPTGPKSPHPTAKKFNPHANISALI